MKAETTPFRRFLSYFRGPHQGLALLALLLTLAVTLLTLTYPMILKYMLDEALQFKDWGRLQVLMWIFGGLFLVRGVLSYASRYLLQKVGMRIVADLRQQIFAHLQNLSLKYYESHQTGQIVARISEDTGVIFMLITNVIVNLLTDSLTLLGVSAWLFYLSPPLALMTMAVLPLFLLNYRLSKKLLKRLSKRHRRNWHRVLGFLHERVSGARLVKSFSMEEREIQRFNSGIERDYKNFNQLSLNNARLWVIADMISSFGGLLVLLVGGWMVIHDKLSVGTLIAFNTYIGFLFSPIVRLSDVNAIIDRSETALEKIFETLDTPSFVVEAKGAEALPTIKGHVRFQDVHFSYDAGHHVLQKLSFEAKPGEMVALVGPSGAGKSTLINLLCRLYDPDQGSILIDGVDIRNVQIKSLRSQIGVVMQETQMFSGSVLDNIRYGAPEASLEQAVAATEIANAHGFITELPQGYQSMVGERGVKLSGGQRQRIAIARALITNPRIMIFDEATSALDSESESLVQEAMERSTRDRTTFVIAHRLSTILKADRILVMEEGELVQQGRHEELVKVEGTYQHLYNLQFKKAATSPA